MIAEGILPKEDDSDKVGEDSSLCATFYIFVHDFFFL
jgi:hypothetical protein